MPTYEYACRACEEHVEVVQSFREDPLTTCGLCGGELRKVFSAAGIIFKGSGYYVTDTRKQDTTARAGGSSKAESSKAESSKADTSKADTSKADSSGTSGEAKSA